MTSGPLPPIPKTRRAALVTIFGLLAASCAIDASSLTIEPTGSGAVSSELAAIGPIPNFTHWHAAYVVRICDQVIVPFDSEADTLGIHSHGDGLIHVHPFSEQGGFENATLSHFTDAMEVGLEPGLLRLPGGAEWRDGDLCDGVPGRVFVDRWHGPDAGSAIDRNFSDPGQLRFEADRELYHIAFAPPDSLPVVPPNLGLLDEVSAPLTDPPQPWVDIGANADSATVSIWPVESVTEAPCAGGQVAEATLVGPGSCFERGDVRLARDQAITGSRAVLYNRNPAVELRLAPALAELIGSWAVDGIDGPNPNNLVLAIEVEGMVVMATAVSAGSSGRDRITITGGLTADSARSLAAVLNG